MPKPFNFWGNVDKSAGPEGCWPWKRYRDASGYGYTSRKGKTIRSARLAFEMHHGTPAKGLVCHTCDNPPCCNPAHLYDGTPKSNMQDKVERGRQPRGSGHGRAKLTERNIIAIRAARKRGVTIVELGKRYAVSHTSISRIALNQTWAH